MTSDVFLNWSELIYFCHFRLDSRVCIGCVRLLFGCVLGAFPSLPVFVPATASLLHFRCPLRSQSTPTSILPVHFMFSSFPAPVRLLFFNARIGCFVAVVISVLVLLRFLELVSAADACNSSISGLLSVFLPIFRRHFRFGLKYSRCWDIYLE